MTKRHVLIMILIAGFVLAFSKYSRADSAICNDIIFTETSDIEITPVTPDGAVFRGIIHVKQIKVFGSGARMYLHAGSKIYFNNMTACIEIEDEVDSIKNLRWFLKKSMDARISNWKLRR